MSSQFANYHSYISEQGVQFTNEYKHEALQQVLNGDTDLRGFIDDSRLHEWCDNDFIYVDLLDSAHIIDQSSNVETDSGLWEGQEPTEAIKTQAFFTYRNDLYNEVSEQFKTMLEEKKEEIEAELEELENNDSDEIETDEEYDSKVSDLQEQIQLLEEAIEDL